MSVGIAAMQENTSTHIAAGNGYAINRYIAELEAQGRSYEYIQRTLELEGLSVAPTLTNVSADETTIDRLPSKVPASCKQIEDALERLDLKAATNALRAFRENTAISRKCRFGQLQCLRMRIEYRHRHKPNSDTYKMLMYILQG